jgi:hypothetical protein
VGFVFFLLLILFIGTVVFPEVVRSAVQVPVSRAQRVTRPSPASTLPAYTSQARTQASSPKMVAEIESTRRSEAERQAEAQRYLERVPELTHYRYSPLDQNKEPQPASSSEPPQADQQ